MRLVSETKLSAAAKLEVHELLHRSAWAYDQARLDVMEACFTADASMSVHVVGNDPTGPYEGRDAVIGLIRASLEAQNDQRRHVISNIFFETESADSAVVISTLTLIAVAEGTLRVLSTGLYRDVVVRQDNPWRFSERQLSLDLPY